MARPKEFSREDVLKNTLQTFWKNGYAGTGLKQLEEATGVNKSGLYSEFKNKEELFIESLKFYFANRPNRELLRREPLGLKNIEAFLDSVSLQQGTFGCFAVNTLRELSSSCAGAEELIDSNRAIIKKLFEQNLRADFTPALARLNADVCLTFYYGLQAEQNLKASRKTLRSRVSAFVRMLRPDA